MASVNHTLKLDETPAPITLKSAFEAAQRESLLNGNADMSLDEINKIIAEVRKERKEKDSKICSSVKQRES